MYNILRIRVVYVFEQHEYLISRHLIWAVLCSLLYHQEGSLKSIKVTLLRCLSLEYYLMVSDVQRTHGSKGLFELLDNFNNPHGGIQNTMQ